MEKPSITPMRDAVMRMIPDVHARCDELVTKGSNPGDARATKRIVAEVMLAMAEEMDLEQDSPQTLASLEAGLANAITSVARTVSNKDGWPLNETVEAFATRICERALALADIPDAQISKVTQRIKRTKKGRRH